MGQKHSEFFKYNKRGARKLRICIIGTFSGNLDEGYRNIAFTLIKRLSKDFQVLEADIKEVYSINFWKKIREFNPEIVHYITAPSMYSFIILTFIKLVCDKDTKFMMSSLHPYFFKLLRNSIFKRLVYLLRPDLITFQCYEIENALKEIGINHKFLANGIDINRFKPVNDKQKFKLRRKYGISPEKFVILHVGHVKNERGLKIFKEIQNEIKNVQVLIVASSYFKTDQKLFKELLASNCMILNEYMENIEEIYALSDSYVFPTPKGNSILMPLSVMEAMCSNIAVFSTEFEGLVDNFEESEGLFFFNEKNELCDKLNEFIEKPISINNREKILKYSWDNVIANLNRIYMELSD